MENKNEGITLFDIVKIIRKNIILCLIIGATITILGILYTTCIVKEKYKSTGTLIVAVKTTGETVDYSTSLMLVRTISELLEKDIVTYEVAQKLNGEGYSVSSSGVQAMISSSYSTSSYLVTVSAIDVDPLLTEKVVNYSMDVLVHQCNTNTELINLFGNSIGVPDYAEEGSYYSPNKVLYVVVSFLCAGVIALAVVFIRELASNKFRDKEDVEDNVKYHIIGAFINNVKLGKENLKYAKLLDANTKNMSPYNKLLSNIKYSSIDISPKVIMFTSSNQGELKSSMAANLAVTIAYNKKKVCLIDFDFSRPTVHKTFDVKKSKGLVEYFAGEIDKQELIKKTSYGVDVITVGEKGCNPTVILESQAMRNFICEMKKEYNYVILDTPPVAVSTDAILASTLADGVVYNIDMTCAKKKIVNTYLNDLANAGANIIGVNLTKCNNNDSSYYDNYYE